MHPLKPSPCPQGQPISFSQEAFLSHKAGPMREFLHSAVHLQLFKQVPGGVKPRSPGLAPMFPLPWPRVCLLQWFPLSLRGYPFLMVPPHGCHCTPHQWIPPL